MQRFMITLLICSATMSVLALFYMVITPILAKGYSAKGRYYAWLVIVIGLIIPFRLHFNNSIIKVDIPGDTATPIIQIGNGTPVTVLAHVENTTLPSALLNISWWQIAAAVWLAGLIIFIAYHVIKHYRFLELTARWSENITDEQTLTLFQNLKNEIGLSKNIGLQSCDSVGSPMMIGFINPKILLPKTNFAKDEVGFILKHELIHYKRRDIWYKCLVLIASAIHWFNPIVYLMARAIDVLCELSCDDEVVLSTDADTRQYYSETIIGVIRYQSKLKTALSTNFYGGKKGMKKRIFSIMDTSKKKAGAAIICIAMIMTTATGLVYATNAAAPPIDSSNTPNYLQEQDTLDQLRNYETSTNHDVSTASETENAARNIIESNTVENEQAHTLNLNNVSKSFNEYLTSGISYNESKNQWLYNDKPIYSLIDEGNFTYIDPSQDENGVSLKVVRDDNGEIEKLIE